MKHLEDQRLMNECIAYGVANNITDPNEIIRAVHERRLAQLAEVVERKKEAILLLKKYTDA